jgi:MYXO-CTERM domain-containing protein
MNVRILAFALITLAFCSFLSVQTRVLAQSTMQRAKIELSVNHQFLRGELAVVNGRLSTALDDRPIALAEIQLQYYRSGETDFTREVIMITSNPSGLFQDIFNTTSLLRIGTWIVNASFPSQFEYESASTIETFTIMVQPALSLYVSSRDIILGKTVTFNGMLFACIPCIQDQIVVTFNRPDNTSISVPLRLVPTGGPYPGGYYNGTFTPDAAGTWRVRAVWKGNEVSLPADSQIEEITVEAEGARSGEQIIFSAAAGVAVLSALALAATLRRRRSRKNSGLSG